MRLYNFVCHLQAVSVEQIAKIKILNIYLFVAESAEETNSCASFGLFPGFLLSQSVICALQNCAVQIPERQAVRWLQLFVFRSYDVFLGIRFSLPAKAEGQTGWREVEGEYNLMRHILK